MTQKMFAIMDSKAEVYNFPFAKLSHGEAERDFKTLCNDDKTTVFKYPEDFDLYYLGTFDTTTGKMECLPTPQHIVKAVALKN